MPHVVVNLVPGKSEEQKTRLAEEITKDIMNGNKTLVPFMPVALGNGDETVADRRDQPVGGILGRGSRASRSLAAIFTKSARESAFIFFITLPRTTNAMTCRSR
jgi:hypothetical protein